MVREHLEHLDALFLAVLLDLLAQDDLHAGFVHALVEIEVPATPRFFDGPAAEDARDLGHIFLRVTAVYPERVQLHELARVVFIQAAFRPVLRLLLLLGIGTRHLLAGLRERTSKRPAERTVLPEAAERPILRARLAC